MSTRPKPGMATAVGGVPAVTENENGNGNENVMTITVHGTVGSLFRSTGKSNSFSFSMQLGEIGSKSWRYPQEPHTQELGPPQQVHIWNLC